MENERTDITKSVANNTVEDAIESANNSSANSGTKGIYVRQGGVVLYPTDIWQKDSDGSLHPIDSDNWDPAVTLSVSSSKLADSVKHEKKRSNKASDYKVKYLTINGYAAAKITYTAFHTKTLCIIYDTPSTNDDCYRSYTFRVEANEHGKNIGWLNDDSTMEIINSFYYDAKYKYSF